MARRHLKRLRKQSVYESCQEREISLYFMDISQANTVIGRLFYTQSLENQIERSQC